ncbi:unnamed protein product [Arctogadus glacialis]
MSRHNIHRAPLRPPPSGASVVPSSVNTLRASPRSSVLYLWNVPGGWKLHLTVLGRGDLTAGPPEYRRERFELRTRNHQLGEIHSSLESGSLQSLEE